jgi:hypothetical protein
MLEFVKDLFTPYSIAVFLGIAALGSFVGGFIW